MSRVLHLPELLLRILQYLDDSSLPSCALVCKGWLECALDLYWKELDCPTPLFALLSPFTKDSPLRFKTPIQADSWKVFDRYAGRVRSLEMASPGTGSCSTLAVSPEVYAEVSMKRPRMTLLPSLRRLRISLNKPEDASHSLLFVGEHVRELELGCPPGAEKSKSHVSNFLDHCSSRVPNLKKFELRAYGPDSTGLSKETMDKFLSLIRGLEEFSGSLYCTTPEVFAALSQVRSLRSITFQHSETDSIGCPDDVTVFSPSLLPGSFPNLTDLSLSLTFAAGSDLFALDFAHQLKKLVIHSPALQEAAQIRCLLTGLSKSRRGLERLVLSSVVDASEEFLKGEDGQETDLVTLETLSPLLKFPSLSEFEVTYHRPLKLTDSDVLDLLKQWPHLEVLRLCSEPLFIEKPLLTPDVLPGIAERCPRLRTLALFIDSQMHRSLSRFPEADQVRPFNALQRIEFGRSPLKGEDIIGICLVLSDMLSETCDIDNLSHIDWLELDADDSEGDLWKRASEVLKAIIAGRGRERMRALQRSL